jgi:hypothetical protein
MMREYCITLNVKTGSDVECLGRFLLGSDHGKAAVIFAQLQSISIVDEQEVLYLDFVEIDNGLPVTLDVRACTLGQLGENCKLITRELFKQNIFSFSSF